MKNVMLLAVILVLALPTEADAYLDPGAGSLLAQLVLGGVAGVVVLFKLYWSKVTDFLRWRKGKSD